MEYCSRDPASNKRPAATRSAADELTVALLIGDGAIPAWVASILRDLRSMTGFLTVIAKECVTPTPRAGLAFRLYERVDAQFFCQQLDALDQATGSDLEPTPLAEVKTYDVAIATVEVNPAALTHGVPRFGLWSLHHMDAAQREGSPALFWEMLGGGVYCTTLKALLPDGSSRLLYESYGAVDANSLRRTRNRAFWKAAQAIVDRLELLQAGGVAYLEAQPRTKADMPRPRCPPGAATTMRQAARAAASLAARRSLNAVSSEPWFLGIRPRTYRTLMESGGVEDGFYPLEPPPGRAYADPFLLEENGKTYVFFEDYDAREQRGRISFVELDADGRPTHPPEPALTLPYHLSYPFVFRHRNEIFMIPESSAARTVSLYRAVGFPSHWALEAVLLDGPAALDATLLAHDDRLWLFAAVASPRAPLNDDLHLYSSVELTGPWEPHRRNPVVADVRSARPAGRIFPSRGRLIRPAQDCSTTYGRAIVLNRIDALDRTEYRETAVATIEPRWHPGLIATHTYALGETFEVVDGRRRVCRARLSSRGN